LLFITSPATKLDTTMFEARLVNGVVFKQIIESITNLVNDVNIDCNEDEMAIQCMDSAHVSLVAISLSAAAFDHYRCDRPLTLGFNTPNMSKIMKMMGKEDTLVLKSEDDAAKLIMMFENDKTGTIADFGRFSFNPSFGAIFILSRV
jgi:proliferating cell nuclear antigen